MILDPFEQREERRMRLLFAGLTFTAGLLLGGYFVIMKTRHDGDIASDTRRIADALERTASGAPSATASDYVKTHGIIYVCDSETKAANPEACR